MTRAELEAFTDQARWLIEYHDRRGESLSTRATALMGFSGVILALLLRGTLPDGVHVNLAIKSAAFATVAMLLTTAYFCLRTLIPGPASAPGVDELREQWGRWVAGQGRGKVLGDIADSYLMGHDEHEQDDYPVGDAYAQADRRAVWLRNAAAALLAALVGLAVLLFLIYEQVT